MDISKEKSLKLQRKEELLLLARRSRSKWVLEAYSSNLLKKHHQRSQDTQPTPIDDSHVRNKSKLAVQDCVQDVIKFLCDIVDDNCYIDVETILDGDNYAPHEDLYIYTSYTPNENIGLNNNKNDIIKATNDVEDPNRDYYFDFIEKLRKPASFEIVKALQQFISKFDKNIRDVRNNTVSFRHNEEDYLEWSNNIWKFIDHITHLIRNHSLWSSDTSDVIWSKTQESIERFIFTKLHPYIFNNDAEDVYLNQRIKEKIQSLSFLLPEHLDIKNLLALGTHDKYNTSASNKLKDLLQDPITQLNQINNARCPYDMLCMIRQCCMSIATIATVHTSLSSDRGADMTIPGADEFLPILILCIKSCELQNIHSIVKYLQRFIHPSKLMSEAGYLLTQFVSAVQFIENVDAKALTIEPVEYEMAMERSKREAEGKYDRLKVRFDRKEKDRGRRVWDPTAAGDQGNALYSSNKDLEVATRFACAPIVSPAPLPLATIP